MTGATIPSIRLQMLTDAVVEAANVTEGAGTIVRAEVAVENVATSKGCRAASAQSGIENKISSHAFYIILQCKIDWNTL